MKMIMVVYVYADEYTNSGLPLYQRNCIDRRRESRVTKDI